MPDQDSTQDAHSQSEFDTGESDEPDADDTASPPDSESNNASPAPPAPTAEHEGATTEPEEEDQSLHFDDDTLGETLQRASKEQLHGAPFGILQVDDDGTVEFYNQYETDVVEVDLEVAEGDNFFTEVAPCTNNRLFRGRFDEGVQEGELNELFTYTFTYKVRPTLVDVHLYRDEADQNWIAIQKH